MSLDPELLSQGFWEQGLQTGVPVLPTSVQYGLAPQPAMLQTVQGEQIVVPEKVGRLRQGGYAKCGSLKGLCGPVDPQSGLQLPYQKCDPPNLLFNCYYDGNPAPARATAVAALSSAPFNKVMSTVYNQPNYGDAVQTFFAGNV